MPNSPRLSKKAQLEKIIAESQAKLELIQKKEAEENRLKSKRFINLLGSAVAKELQEGDSLDQDAIYALLDKHIIRGVDRKFLNGYLGLALETKAAAKKRKTASKVSSKKESLAVQAEIGHNLKVADIKEVSLERKTAKNRADVPPSVQPVITPLPMTNSQDELASEFFFNEDYESLKTGEERGL